MAKFCVMFKFKKRHHNYPAKIFHCPGSNVEMVDFIPDGSESTKSIIMDIVEKASKKTDRIAMMEMNLKHKTVDFIGFADDNRFDRQDLDEIVAYIKEHPEMMYHDICSKWPQRFNIMKTETGIFKFADIAGGIQNFKPGTDLEFEINIIQRKGNI